MKLLILGLCLLAAGCETAPVRRVRQFAHDHPVMTGAGVALLAGSIAASANHGDSGREHDVHVPGNPCATPTSCQ